ncbi:uncharacterized protein LOC118464768 isoform X1 [Anopheles albimanus]|uniref:uncharacterized protein LOC118464768 isoform X1 n=1 Tax=Anopheles albimanus TaxID=7167 RepID=UPI00163F5211|nr:uncharacterized protein LOC118464768 isoform X1 [Anopheles albimanus]
MLPRVVPVLFLLVMSIIQASAIVDFNAAADPDSDAQACCKVEHSFPREPFVECAAQLKLNLSGNVTNDQLMCLHKCYYERIGMFEGTKLNAAQYQRYAQGLDEQLKEVFERSMPVCASFTVKVMKTSKALGRMVCTPVPYLFNRCLAEVGIAMCPKERQIVASFCDNLSMKVKQKYGLDR